MLFSSIPFDIIDRLASLVFLLLLIHMMGEAPAGNKGRNKRLVFFDVVKGLAMLGVVGIHTAGIVTEGAALNRIIWISLPLFVIASGYLLARRHPDPSKLKWADHARSVFWRLLLPYAVYSILSSLFQSNYNILSILQDLVFGRQNGYTLFFIPLLLQLYLLFPLIMKYRKMLFTPGALCLIFLLSYSLSDWDHSLRSGLWNDNLWSLIFCGRYLFYFIAGLWLSKWDLEKEKLPGEALLLLAGVPLLLVTFVPNGWDQPFFYPIWALLLLHWIYERIKNNVLGKLALIPLIQFGQYSLMIYFLHTVIIYQLAEPLKYEWPVSGWGAYVLVALGTAALTWVFGKIVWDSYAGLRHLMAN